MERTRIVGIASSPLRLLALGGRVLLGAAGALGGRANAVAPPPTPPAGPHQEYRP